MKLFSWMHRKLQKDVTGSLQASVVGSSCTCLFLKPSANNQGDYITPSNEAKQKWQQKGHCQHHIKEFNPENNEEFNDKESTDIFPGFLTIGTLSMDPISEAPTPTFDLPHQVTNEGGMAEMKYDLKLINEELERFLKVEAEKEGTTDSSRRNSQASTITLSDEVNEEVSDHNSTNKQVYPLQGYLLGSSTELLITKPKAKKEKTFLYELFKKSTKKDRRSIKEADRTLRQATKEIKSSDHLMSKMQHTTQTSPKITRDFTGHAAESFLNLRKLNKINQLFHTKVHREISKAASAAKEAKFGKHETRQNNSYEDSVLKSSGKSRAGCWGTLKKRKKQRPSTDMKLPQDAITQKDLDLPVEDTSGDAATEHWIKTDEEYFVLELQQNEGVQK